MRTIKYLLVLLCGLGWIISVSYNLPNTMVYTIPVVTAAFCWGLFVGKMFVRKHRY